MYSREDAFCFQIILLLHKQWGDDCSLSLLTRREATWQLTADQVATCVEEGLSATPKPSPKRAKTIQNTAMFTSKGSVKLENSANSECLLSSSHALTSILDHVIVTSTLRTRCQGYSNFQRRKPRFRKVR